MIELADCRITLVTALSWRAMTELVRRHHPGHVFRLRQIHPGISLRGLIELELEDRRSGDLSLIRFNLGGACGRWEVASGESGNVAGLLGTDPVAIIEQMERVAGLPASLRRLAPSSDGVMAMRLIANALQRKVFEPVPWRITLGLVGRSDDIIPDWHRHFVERVHANGVSGVDREDQERLSQLVLLHEAKHEEPLASQGDLSADALAVDLATGMVARLTVDRFVQLGAARHLTGIQT